MGVLSCLQVSISLIQHFLKLSEIPRFSSSCALELGEVSILETTNNTIGPVSGANNLKVFMTNHLDHSAVAESLLGGIDCCDGDGD